MYSLIHFHVLQFWTDIWICNQIFYFYQCNWQKNYWIILNIRLILDLLTCKISLHFLKVTQFITGCFGSSPIHSWFFHELSGLTCIRGISVHSCYGDIYRVQRWRTSGSPQKLSGIQEALREMTEIDSLQHGLNGFLTSLRFWIFAHNRG